MINNESIAKSIMKYSFSIHEIDMTVRKKSDKLLKPRLYYSLNVAGTPIVSKLNCNTKFYQDKSGKLHLDE